MKGSSHPFTPRPSSACGSARTHAAKQHMDAGDVIAAYTGTVKTLLGKGADVNLRDKVRTDARP